MTTGYAFISIIALVCYLFLFLTFIAAKKNNLINIAPGSKEELESLLKILIF